MMRMVFAATMSAKMTMTAATIRPATTTPLFGYQRRGALDLHDVHLLADLDDLVLVVGPRGPDLVLEADRAAVAADGLEDLGPLADQRRRARAQLRRHRHVALGDRPQEREDGHGEGEEEHELNGTADADHRGDRGDERANGERREEERSAGGHLPDAEDDRGDQPPGPVAHAGDLMPKTYPVVSRRARAKSSASNGRRSSTASPIQISLTGMPISPAMASAIPPFAVPSSLVSTIPSTGTVSENSLAWRSPFWPVVASTVSSVSCGASGVCLVITRRTLASSAISSSWVCRRPAVSTITTSTPRWRPRATASNATAPGSEPSGPVTSSAPARWAHSASCSTAAARYVSAAPTRTDLPACSRRCQASLPIVVVLPVPLTPATMITVGSSSSSMVPSAGRARSAISSMRRWVRASPPVTSPSVASCSSCETIFAVVVAPTSAMISASSRRSQVSSLTSSNSVAWTSAESARRVFDMFSRRRRKNPPRFSSDPSPAAPASAVADGPSA